MLLKIIQYKNETKNEKKSNWSKSFILTRCYKRLKTAINEGYDRIEHLKRYTTNSMGTDQGKISSINSLGIVSKLLNKKFPKLALQHTDHHMPH